MPQVHVRPTTGVVDRMWPQNRPALPCSAPDRDDVEQTWHGLGQLGANSSHPARHSVFWAARCGGTMSPERSLTNAPHTLCSTSSYPRSSMGPNLGRHRVNFVPARPECGRNRTNFVDFAQPQPKSPQDLAESVIGRLAYARFSQTWLRCGLCSATFGRFQSEALLISWSSAQIGSNQDHFGPTQFLRSRPDFARR